MTRRDYTARVLKQLRGLSWGERDAIEAELNAHMEDHVCAFMDLGYDETLAEERTILRMGDPEEVGRELKKQYPRRWRWVIRLCILVFAVMGLYAMMLAPDDEYSLLDGLGNRNEARQHVFHQLTEGLAGEELDLRFSAGDDRVRVLHIAVGKSQEGMLMASVYADAYDRFPGGPVARIDLILENQRGQQAVDRISRSRWWSDGSVRVPIEPEDTYVVLRCAQFGNETVFQIPLPEVEMP